MYCIFYSIHYFTMNEKRAKRKQKNIFHFDQSKCLFTLKALELANANEKILLDAIQNFSTHCCFADIAMRIVIS